MGIQELLLQLQDIPGLGGYGYSELGSITPEQILQSMAGMYPVQESQLSEGMFSGFSPTQIQGTLGKTYSPLMEEKGKSLLGKLTQTMGGAQATQAAGGFAGSGQFGRYAGGAKDVYGAGFSDTLKGIQGSKATSATNLMDTIQQWKTATEAIL